MLKLRQGFVSLVMFWAAAALCWGQDRTFLLPSGGSSVVTVLDASDLSSVGTVSASVSTFRILATPQADKYYMVSRTGADAIVVVDVQTLDVIKRINLDSGVRDAVVTPNGEYLVVAAGGLRIFSTQTDEQVGGDIEVGSGPHEIEVNARSTRAYVLAGAGRVINIVDLTERTVMATIDTPNTVSIGLVEQANRLVALQDAGLQTYDLGTNEPKDLIPPAPRLLNGILHPIPGTSRVFVRNRGSAPLNTSQIFNLVEGTVTPVGLVGTFGIHQVVFSGSDRAFAILSDAEDLAEIDLTAMPTATVTPLDIGFRARSVSISPSGGLVYVSSFVDATIARYDTTTAAITHAVMPAIAPRENVTIFAPSTLPPAAMTILGGQDQFIPPGVSTPITLTVLVTDEDDNPLFDVPVFFDAPARDDVTFDAEQPVRTNSQGIVAVNATVNLPPPPEAPEPEALGAAPLAPIALNEGAARLPPTLTVDPPAGTGEEPVEAISITAVASGGLSVVFTLNVVRVAGIHIVSGNFQTAFPRKPFRKPFVVLATDEAGNPLPSDTSILFSLFGADCAEIIVPVDANGFAQVECVAQELPPNVPFVREGSIVTSVLNMLTLGTVTFDISVSIGADLLELVDVSGNGQSGDTDKPLGAPLVFRLESPFTGLGAVRTGVEINQVTGSPALITPRFVAVRSNVDTPVAVLLGPPRRAGRHPCHRQLPERPVRGLYHRRGRGPPDTV